MPNNHCQVQLSDIPFLDRFSKDINTRFALATFWEFYQNNIKKNKYQEFCCTTSDVARYSLEEGLAIIDKTLVYDNEVKLDYCVVNHRLAYYKKISRLISHVLHSLPFVTVICKIEGVSTYNLAVVDINQEKDLYFKLAKAIATKNAIIKNIIMNKTSYLEDAQKNIDNGLVKSAKTSTCLTKQSLILPKPMIGMEKSTMLSYSPSENVDTLVDENFFTYIVPKTYFYTCKRKQIQRDDFIMEDGKTKIIKSGQDKLNQPDKNLASNEANNVQQVCQHTCMDIKFLLN